MNHVKRANNMKPTEARVTFVMDADEWFIIKLIASKIMCYKDGKIRACTGSDVIREMLMEWLAEKSVEWYPKILEEFKRHDVRSRARDMIEEGVKLLEEGRREEEKGEK